MNVRVEAARRFGTVSPLRYPGGKSALAGLFADLITDLGIRNCTYVEPYAGGVGAGIAPGSARSRRCAIQAVSQRSPGSSPT